MHAGGLGDGDIGRDAIDGGRGRVDDARAVEFVHEAHEVDRAGDIVVVVRERDLG